jgi:hypothetical protein
MTRADVRTFAWMLSLALALVIGWMSWVNPCLDDEIATNWGKPDRPAREVAATAPDGTDVIAVENPYGIETCDYFPSMREVVVNDIILFVIVMLVGFLCARHFQIHAARRAAVTMFIAMCIAGVISSMAYGLDVLAQESAIMLAVAFVGAAIAWLSAFLTLRWRPRA